MYDHRVLFELPNFLPSKRIVMELSYLLSVELTQNTHRGLGGEEKHWLLAIKLADGAGHQHGRTMYVGHDLFARPSWGVRHHNPYHGQTIHNRQGIRLPWQIGFTRHADAVPTVDG